jgi:N utilization substance protein B
MLSRRNIRIKVMQVLYAMNRDQDMSYTNALNLYQLNIKHSFELYLLNLLQLLKIAEYSKADLKRKRSKLRPTEKDLRFTPKLFDNPLTHSLESNYGLKSLFTRHKIGAKLTEDNTRSLYVEFSKTEDYQNYLDQKESSAEDHKKALLSLYRFCVGNELFSDIIEDHYMSWIDDRSLVVGAMKKTLKALPADGDFFKDYMPPDETVKDFGEVLLKKVNADDANLSEIIEPTLKNWDAERVAVIDMILLKMAVCELISFPTIPTKVTLNEFVEISKLYSTDKSKDFINGILDRLMKKLEKEGKIVKEGRGLIED